MKNKFLYLFIIVFCQNLFSQTRIKGNVLLMPLGMLNGAMEAKVSDKFTIQPEVFVSPWKSFLDKRFEVYYASTEARYYFKESFEGFYVGGNVGVAFFHIKKWNYLDSPKYQRGTTFLMGATLGYQYKISEKLNADFFFGGGNSQAFYHGYYEGGNERYDDVNPWNRSGEWIPYKGGVMISYKLK